MQQSAVLAAVLVLAGISIAVSGGARIVIASPSAGAVTGTGSITNAMDQTHTISINASVDDVGNASGTFTIMMEVFGGPSNPPSFGDVTCLVIDGSSAVVGGHLPGSSVSGVFFITDAGSGPNDTLWLNDPAPDPSIADCSDDPSGTPILLQSGDFTVDAMPSSTVGPTPHSTPPAPPPGYDGDNDGIADVLQPSGTPSGSFDDQTLMPPTVGSVVATADPVWGIVDASDPLAGVEITTSGTPGAQLSLTVCGGFPLIVDANSFVELTCGSVGVKVISGRASIVLGGGITVVSIPTGGAAEVTDTGGGTYLVENTGPEGSPSVSLTVDGTTTTLPPGGPPTTAGTSDFVGFSQPVDNKPVLNRVKAGQAVPIKWRLLTATGVPITNLSSASITVTTLSCSLGTTADQVEEVTAGASGLQNLGNGYYQMNWKSPKTYAQSCKTLHLNVHDGVSHDALFQFTK